MLGYGYGNSVQPNKLAFNPLNIRGLQLYLNSNNATPSSWLDQSTNAFDFVQATGTKQPTIITNGDGSTKAVYDGVDDFQIYSAAQPLNDASGIIHFSWYSDGVNAQNLLSSADNATDNNYLMFQERNNQTLRVVTLIGATVNAIETTNNTVVGYNYGYIKSTGTSYEIMLNGVIEVLVIIIGSNDGTWFSDVPNKDNLTIASLQRLTPFYTPNQSNKVVYSNANLTTAEINDINTFMSIPTN